MASINQLTQEWARSQAIDSHFLNEIDSTNTWAKKDYRGPALSVFLADTQTRGRGRNQNTWTQAPHGSTLLSTWCLTLEQSPQPLVSMRVGLALFKSYMHVWPHLPWALKAPNDIYLSGAKQSGILIEAEQEGSRTKIFIGIGANIFDAPTGVGQAVTFVQKHAEVKDEDWFKFCFHLSQNFLALQKDAHRSQLIGEEQKQLLQALERYPANHITEVHSDGSLNLKDGGLIHWRDL